jgi:hypothetical protein
MLLSKASGAKKSGMFDVSQAKHEALAAKNWLA